MAGGKGQQQPGPGPAGKDRDRDFGDRPKEGWQTGGRGRAGTRLVLVRGQDGPILSGASHPTPNVGVPGVSLTLAALHLGVWPVPEHWACIL